MPASSQASSELSTASFTVVSSAFAGLSKPSRWRFFVKNSLTEMSRWRVAIDSAVARRFGGAGSSSTASVLNSGGSGGSGGAPAAWALAFFCFDLAMASREEPLIRRGERVSSDGERNDRREALLVGDRKSTRLN